MNKNLLLLIIPVLVLGFNGLQANAYYVQQQDNSYEDNPNVDVFKPSSGVQVKTSPLAQMMENATKNATQKNDKKNTQQQTKPQQQNQSSWF